MLPERSYTARAQKPSQPVTMTHEEYLIHWATTECRNVSQSLKDDEIVQLFCHIAGEKFEVKLLGSRSGGFIFIEGINADGFRDCIVAPADFFVFRVAVRKKKT